jgi:alpha-glucosidase
LYVYVHLHLIVMVGLLDLLAGACLLPAVYGASSTPSPSATTSSAYHQFSLPASADEGANLIANIDDPQAINAQSACPGYKASNVLKTSGGVTATLQLAGQACNAYGTDIESLDLTVEYLAKDRLNVLITPTHVDASNASWYQLDEHIVPRPLADKKGTSDDDSDLEFTWSNDPSFSFTVTRKSTGDVLFDTSGSVLVYQNQFIEFVTALPANYNLYGLGEHIRQLRLLPNATLTIYAADAADPIDR